MARTLGKIITAIAFGIGAAVFIGVDNVMAIVCAVVAVTVLFS